MDFIALKLAPSLPEENEELLAKIYSRRERRTILVMLNNNNNNHNRRLAHFKDPRPVFYSGEELSGRLMIEVIGGQPVQQVKLMLVSLIQIQFRKQQPMPSSNQNKRRKSIFSDLYFGSGTEQSPDPADGSIHFDRQRILQFDLLRDDKQLSDGKHEIPFRFRLPEAELPSSMKSLCGLIKYTIEAFTIDQESFNESRGEKEIIFLAPIHDLAMLKQINRIVEKTFTIDSGGQDDDDDGGGGGDDENIPTNHITIQAILERKTYNLGEPSKMELTIENQTNQDVECLISIVQRQTIMYEDRRQTIDTSLNIGDPRQQPKQQHQLIGLMVQANETIKKQPIQFHLPNNLVLTLECGWIAVKYHVVITVQPQQNIDGNIPFLMEIPFVVSIDKNHQTFGTETQTIKTSTITKMAMAKQQ